jgi:hypothetical protein
MIGPEALLQGAEALDKDFRASVRLQAKELHCGLGINGYYCKPSWIQKYATRRVFVAVLAAFGFLQGAAMGYFTATANVVAGNLGFPHDIFSTCILLNSHQ